MIKLDIDPLIDQIWGEGKQRFPCHLCNHVASQKFNLNAHIRGKHEGNRYECKICVKNFNYSNNYKLHMRNQHSIDNICIICYFNAPSELALKIHKKEFKHYVRINPCNLICSYCNYKATTKQNLLKHIRSKHEGQKYNCNKCDKTFNYPNTLKEHRANIHMKVRYPCNICDYKAASRGCLSAHRKLKHLDDYKENLGKRLMKRFHCKKCEFSTTLNIGLKMHVKKNHHELMA